MNISWTSKEKQHNDPFIYTLITVCINCITYELQILQFCATSFPFSPLISAEVLTTEVNQELIFNKDFNMQ